MDGDIKGHNLLPSVDSGEDERTKKKHTRKATTKWLESLSFHGLGDVFKKKKITLELLEEGKIKDKDLESM